jgi:hypothetical protein
MLQNNNEVKHCIVLKKEEKLVCAEVMEGVLALFRKAGTTNHGRIHAISTKILKRASASNVCRSQCVLLPIVIQLYLQYLRSHVLFNNVDGFLTTLA